MSTKRRVILLILNLLCIPVNIWTLSRGWAHRQSSGLDFAFWNVNTILAFIALIWCSAVVVSYSKALLNAKQP